MSKHPLDHGRGGSISRMERFVQVERAEKPSDASKKLQQRAKNETGSRLDKFIRIERGVES